MDVLRAARAIGSRRKYSRPRMLRGGAGASRYAGHVPTTLFEKALLASSSAIRALADPRDARLVGVVGEATGHAALLRMRTRMRQHPVGRAILKERPVVSEATVPTSWLRSLPEHTFGAEYAKYLDKHGFSPDERPSVRFVDDEELAYIILRYRQARRHPTAGAATAEVVHRARVPHQVHDFWHVLLGLPPSMVGEVALKWAELAQTGLPMCALGAFAGGARLAPQKLALVVRHVLPWAARHAAGGADLMCVYYERELERPLDELRHELRLTMPLPPSRR